MYACANCATWLWQKNIFCNACDISSICLLQRSIAGFPHYYFLPWNHKSKQIILSLKNGRHTNWLLKHSDKMKILLDTDLYQQNVYIAPASTGLTYTNNHAYHFAHSLGFLNIYDILQRRRKQAFEQDKKLRWQNQVKAKVRPGKLNNIVIIDDVVTSGATIRSILQILRPKNASVISLSYVNLKR